MSVVAILGYRFLDHGIRTRQFNHRSKQRLKTVDLIIKHGQRRNGDWPWPLGPPTFSQILGTCVDNHSIFGYWRSYFVYVKKRHSSFDGDFNNPVGWLVFFSGWGSMFSTPVESKLGETATWSAHCFFLGTCNAGTPIPMVPCHTMPNQEICMGAGVPIGPEHESRQGPSWASRVLSNQTLDCSLDSLGWITRAPTSAEHRLWHVCKSDGR